MLAPIVPTMAQDGQAIIPKDDLNGSGHGYSTPIIKSKEAQKRLDSVQKMCYNIQTHTYIWAQNGHRYQRLEGLFYNSYNCR